MLFSMFFGAGNLILPPLLGLQAGEAATPAMVGFLIAGIGLPVLGIVAVALCGDVRTLTSRVHPRFASAFIMLMYLTIGPFLAIPRTSSTAYEMLRPLIPGADASLTGTDGQFFGFDLAAVAFTIAFFGVAFLLALRPGLLSRALGKFSAPALIALIVIVVGACLLGEPATPTAAQAPYDKAAVANGFLTGYQTMDLLAALCFGIVVAANVRNMGAREPSQAAGAITAAGLIAGALMMAIYCGLGFVGATLSGSMPNATNGAAILTAAANAHFGSAGVVLIAAIFLIACLNVCTGLISCCAEYFSKLTPRMPLAAWAATFTIFSCGVSLMGLDAILMFSMPLLGALYPPAIVLVVLGMLHTLADRTPRVWPWAVLTAASASVAVALRDTLAAGAWIPLDALPFAEFGLGWVLPTLIGGAVGVAHSLVEKRKGRELSA